MGNFADLIDKLGGCKIQFKNFTKSELISEKCATIEIIHLATLVKNAADSVVEAGSQFITKLNVLKNNIVLDEGHEESELAKHDPGQRPKKLTENQKHNLIQLGPHQPQLTSYPLDGKNKRFYPTWYKEFEHLEYSTEKDAAFCFSCSLFPEGIGREKKEEAWVTDGVKNWSKLKSKGKNKLLKLQQHFGSNTKPR